MFKNNSENKETKAIIIFAIGSILILLSFVCKIVESTAINRYYKGYSNLFSTTKLSNDNKLSYLTIDDIQELNTCQTNTHCYYIVRDDIYSFIIKMDINYYQKLKKENLKKNNIKVIGTTEIVTTTVKEQLLTAYNEINKDTVEMNLESDEFDKLFGKNLLDTTINTKNKAYISDKAITRTPKILFISFLILGFICYIYSIVSYKKNTY